MIVVLLLVGLSAYSHAAVLIDGNISHIQENDCITIDFLEKYDPSYSPAQNPEVFTVNYRTTEEMAEVLTLLYGCDILEEESKLNPDDEYQDGTVYILWGLMGRKTDGHPKKIFDFIESRLFVTTRMSFDERLYSTFEEALTSPEMERSVKQYGAEKMYIQAFTLDGEDKGLFDLDRSLIEGGSQ